VLILFYFLSRDFEVGSK